MRSAMAGAIANEQLMLQQQRFRSDGTHATGAQEFHEGDQQVDGEDEEFAHGTNRIKTASARKTAPRWRIPSYYEFATDRLADDRDCDADRPGGHWCEAKKPGHADALRESARLPMKLFLSYPSAHRELAERLTLALEAEGHEVFIDRADLKAGESFHQTLREAILGADAMVFLVTPEAVASGSYALAELNIAQQRWRRPSGHVLPVMVVDTPIAALPSYLSAVTVLQPRGEAVAEIVAAVALLTPPATRRRLRIAAVAALGLVALAAVGIVVSRHSQQSRAEQARLEAQQRDLAQAASARELCDSGGHAVAMVQLNELVAGRQPPAQVLDAREDCAMRWLREMRATAGRTTFTEQVAQTQPVLLQGLPRASGARAADLRSHIGWGEYLRGRDGAAGADPVAHWRRALADDADNVYANAMWARQMLNRGGRFHEAKTLFAKAEASARDRPFVRALQFGGTLGGNIETARYAVVVADQMRRGGEAIEQHHRDALWSGALGASLMHADARATLFTALPPAQLLETFDWLYPDAEVRDERRMLWRFVRATLLANNGDRVAARAGFESLVAELRAANRSGRLLDEAQHGLDRLRQP